MSGSRRRVPRLTIPCVLILMFSCCSLPALGIAPWAEPLPWDALTGNAGFIFDAQRFDDPDSDWQVDAFGMTSVMRHGADNRIYLRWRHLTFHTGGH